MLAQEFWDKKSPKTRKGRKFMMYQELNLFKDKEKRRPHSTGDLKEMKVWKMDDCVVARSRAATCSGFLPCFSDYNNTTTCYNCLYDAAKGRQFCEIMGSKYCHQCIKGRKRQELDLEISSYTPEIAESIKKTSVSETAFATIHKPSVAFPSHRNCFVRLHNLNNTSEYYINPIDGIKPNLVSSCQKLVLDGSLQGTFVHRDKKVREANQETAIHDQNQWLRVPGIDPGTLRRNDETLARKKRRTGTVKRKFVTFNGLPIEPPLITVDLSNQIMNHLVLKDL